MASTIARRRNGALYGVLSLLALLGVIALVLSLTLPTPSPNPFLGRDLYVYPGSRASQAAADASGAEKQAFTKLANTPTAIWLLPEEHPVSEIAEFVNSVEKDAAAKDQLPVFVVYGVPSRDCDNFSRGGTKAADYPKWISAIAKGIASRPTVVILEPDALALSPSCGTEKATAGFIDTAITRLTAPGVTIYLDAGHSSWLGAEVMAPLMRAAGVERVRGFVTNVSNYNTTADERDYGDRLSEMLGGVHYVIDTSRNGKGSNGEWCNPSGRRIGDIPTAVDDGSAEDASLWVKNPGESDGRCNGGPRAGAWWPERALELVDG